jgi:hypothetical protein
MGDIAGFYWKAEFNDNYIIKQFDESDKEILFKEVLCKGEEDLKSFKLFNIKDEEIVDVDFVNQSIKLKGKKLQYIKGDNPRLIYRRRIVRGVKGVNGNLMTNPSMIKHQVGIRTNKEIKIAEVYLEQNTDEFISKIIKE